MRISSPLLLRCNWSLYTLQYVILSMCIIRKGILLKPSQTFSSRKRYGRFHSPFLRTRVSKVPRRVNAITPRLTGNRRPGGREIIPRGNASRSRIAGRDGCVHGTWTFRGLWSAIGGYSPLCPNEWRFLVGACTSPWYITLDAHAVRALRDAKEENNCILYYITLERERERAASLLAKLSFWKINNYYY